MNGLRHKRLVDGPCLDFFGADVLDGYVLDGFDGDFVGADVVERNLGGDAAGDGGVTRNDRKHFRHLVGIDIRPEASRSVERAGVASSMLGARGGLLEIAGGNSAVVVSGVVGLAVAARVARPAAVAAGLGIGVTRLRSETAETRGQLAQLLAGKRRSLVG